MILYSTTVKLTCLKTPVESIHPSVDPPIVYQHVTQNQDPFCHEAVSCEQKQDTSFSLHCSMFYYEVTAEFGCLLLCYSSQSFMSRWDIHMDLFPMNWLCLEGSFQLNMFWKASSGKTFRGIMTRGLNLSLWRSSSSRALISTDSALILSLLKLTSTSTSTYYTNTSPSVHLYNPAFSTWSIVPTGVDCYICKPSHCGLFWMRGLMAHFLKIEFLFFLSFFVFSSWWATPIRLPTKYC